MERLTMCIDSYLLDNGELDKEYSLNSKIKLNDYSCIDIPNAVYNKLGELEDVLEKYGIESVEELDNIIHCNTTNALIESENKTMLELQNGQLQHQLAVKDKALELACDYLVSVEGDGLYELCEDIYDDKEYLKVKIDYFETKAEKELKDE